MATPCDCRSFDLQTYSANILKQRAERFSTIYGVCFITAEDTAAAAAGLGPGEQERLGVDLLATASSIGEIRLYRVPEMVSRWTGSGQHAEAACGWTAHAGPVYCLTTAREGPGGGLVLVSGGDDGFVRCWRLSDALHALAAAEAEQQQQQAQQQAQGQGAESGAAGAPPGAQSPPPLALPGLRPWLEVRLPRAEQPLAAVALPPAVQALAVAPAAGEGAEARPATVFAGCSDGGVHCVDLAAPAAAYPPQPQPQAEPGWAGHAAGVLAMDFNATSACLATGSEDGTIRLWDARPAGIDAPAAAAPSGRAPALCLLPSRALDTGPAGAALPGSGGGAATLRCLRHPAITCLRFEPGGAWLLAGHAGPPQGQAQAANAKGGAGGGGCLSLWSVGMGTRARQLGISFVPQALDVSPAEVLVAGSGPALLTTSLALASAAPDPRPLAAPRAAWALARHPASGAVAVAGLGGALELRSAGGRRLGGAAPAGAAED